MEATELPPTVSIQASEPVITLEGPIADLEKIVEVNPRYQSLLKQLLQIYQGMYNEKDKSILFETQPLTMFIQPDNAEKFKSIMNRIRNHLNVTVQTAPDCRKRLTALKGVYTTEEQRSLINNALDLLNLPNSTEVQNDADFRLLELQRSAKDMNSAVEIQEIFIYLNSMFQPVVEKKSSSNRRNR
jgi:hypothetical protein